jgi:hypothetical protein
MKKALIRMAGVLLLAVSLTACGSGSNPTALPVDQPTPVVEAAAPTPQPDPCGNPYFPVRNRVNHEYSSSGSPAGVYTFRNVISNAKPEGFTLTTKFNRISHTINWECRPEGIVAMGFGLTDAASSLAIGQFTNFTASNITGVSMPSNLAPGLEWTYALDLQGTELVKPGEPAGNMTGHVSMTFKAGNIENITVPAGVFDAIAIEVKTVSEFKLTRASGQTQKITSHTTYTIWYAPGVGWIKSNGSGNLNGQEYFETIVLESYKIP